MLRSSGQVCMGFINVLWSLFYSLPLSGEEMDLVIDTASDGNERCKLVGYVYKSEINMARISTGMVGLDESKHRYYSINLKKANINVRREKIYKSTRNKNILSISSDFNYYPLIYREV